MLWGVSKTLDDVVAELGAIRTDDATIRTEMVTMRTEMVTRSDFASESASVRTEHEDLKEELLRALGGISTQQASFISLLTRLLNDREEVERRFAKLEAAVFGSKH